MKKSKQNKIIIISCIICIIISLLFLINFNFQPTNKEIFLEDFNPPEEKTYQTTLFDTSYVHNINVEIAPEDWMELIRTPEDKTKYPANVTIDGEKIEHISFSVKGGYTITATKKRMSNCFSFKLNFGKYEKGQNFYGLDKVHLNNCIMDPSHLRDYLSYDVMRQAGISAPLVSFVKLTVNGENFGLYVAVEDVDDSFLARNHHDKDSIWYKPENPEMVIVKKDPQAVDSKNIQDAGENLLYIDNNLNSYLSIFNNSAGKPTDEDKQFVIEAIQALNTNENVENYWNMDEIIRYFAANNLMLSMDSYIGEYAQNYYLLQENDELSILPWDYDFSFGSFVLNDPRVPKEYSDIYHWDVDNPTFLCEEKDRPLWTVIKNNSAYLEKYHQEIQKLIENYFEKGIFEEKINALSKMIEPEIDSTPLALHRIDEYHRAIEQLKDFNEKRILAVKEQLQ